MSEQPHKKQKLNPPEEDNDPSCFGCQYDAPSQIDHMGYGGCLFLSPEYYQLPRPVFAEYEEEEVA